MIQHECNNCSANFTIDPADPDTADMFITHCPFCGTEIIDELDFS